MKGRNNAVIEFESYAPPRIEEKQYCESTLMWPPDANTTTHHATIDWFTCPRKEARRYRVTVEELSEDPIPNSEVPRPREAGETAKARVDWRRSPEFADHLEDMVRAMAQKMSDKDGHCHVSLRQLMFVARHIREASD